MRRLTTAITVLIASLLPLITPTTRQLAAQPSSLKFKPSANLGLRYQLEDPPENNQDNNHNKYQHRLRLAAGIGASVTLSRTLQIVIHLRATDGSDPRDSHVELGELGTGIDPLGVAIERAFFRFAPTNQWWRGLRIDAGIVDHPTHADPSQWDRDLAPAGATASYYHRLKSIPMSIEPSMFAYLIQSDSRANPTAGRNRLAAGMLGGEIHSEIQQNHITIELTALGTAFYRHQALALRSVDNSRDSEQNLIRNFRILEFSSRIKVPERLYAPVELHASLIRNIRSSHKNNGLIVGGSVEKHLWNSQFSLSYSHRYIEKDAVISALASDDFMLTTDLSGDRLEVEIKRNSYQVGLTVFAFKHISGNPRTLTAEDIRRYRFRLDIRAVF